ncbi:MAG: hypothetical protein ABJA87_13225 [bacterium]
MADDMAGPELLDVADVTFYADVTSPADDDVPTSLPDDSPPDGSPPPDVVVTGRHGAARPVRYGDVVAAGLLLAALVLSVAALGSEVSRRTTHSTTLAPPQSALTSVVTERTDAWGRVNRSTAAADRARPSAPDSTATASGATLAITPGYLDRLAGGSALGPDDGPALGVAQTLAAAAMALTLAAVGTGWWRRRVDRIPWLAVVGVSAQLIASTVTAAELVHRRQVAAARATRYLVLNDTADRAISVTVSAGRFLTLSAAATACALLATAVMVTLRFRTEARGTEP